MQLTELGQSKIDRYFDWHAGDQIPVWVDRGVLRLPKDARRPIVMIGPGTGVAPFRAFAQELLARNPQGMILHLKR